MPELTVTVTAKVVRWRMVVTEFLFGLPFPRFWARFAPRLKIEVYVGDRHIGNHHGRVVVE